MMNIEKTRPSGFTETCSESTDGVIKDGRETWLPELKNPIPEFRQMEVRQYESRSWDDVSPSKNRETGEMEIRLRSGEDSDILNQVPCPPNTQLRIDDKQGGNYTLETTDDRGRISSVERPKLELVDASERQRDPVQTGRTFELKDGLSDSDGERMDDGGHLVADEFGGSSEQTNLVPMDSEVNRHGEWRDMERQIEKELKSEPASEITDYKVNVAYEGDSSRPSSFEVSYNVDGEPVQFVILNERQEGDIRDVA